VCATACQMARLIQPEISPFLILYVLFEFLPVESAPQPTLRDDWIFLTKLGDSERFGPHPVDDEKKIIESFKLSTDMSGICEELWEP